MKSEFVIDFPDDRTFNSPCIICRKRISYEPHCSVTPKKSYRNGGTIYFHASCYDKEQKGIKSRKKGNR